MNQLLKTPETMSSREIAEYTNKMHKHVLEAIRTMEPAWVEVTGTKFRLSEYTDPTGRKLPQYELTKKECLYIATKFNDTARARLINRWEELESKKATIDFSNPQAVLQLAQNWAEEQQKRIDAEQKAHIAQAERDRYEQELKLAAPKIVMFDHAMNSKNTLVTNQIAKEFGMSDRVLNAILRDLGIQYKQNGQWLLTHKHQGKGYTRTKTTSGINKHGEEWSANQTVWLQKGRMFLYQTIKPLIDKKILVCKSGAWFLNNSRVKVIK